MNSLAYSDISEDETKKSENTYIDYEKRWFKKYRYFLEKINMYKSIYIWVIKYDY